MVIVLFKCARGDYGVSELCEGFICWFGLFYLRGRNLVKIRLYVKIRSKSRSRIESVPLKRLVELSVFPKRSWSFKNGC